MSDFISGYMTGLDKLSSSIEATNLGEVFGILTIPIAIAVILMLIIKGIMK